MNWNPKALAHLTAAAGFVAVFWPSLRWYAARLGDGADERMGLVVLLVGLALAWAGRPRLKPHPAGRAIAVALTLGYLVALGSVPNLIAAALGILAVVSYWGLWRMPGVVALLLLSLPLVASLQFYLGYPLRLMTAMGSEWMLAGLGVEIERVGVQLITGGTTVGVDPACSGVKMLWAGGVYTALLVAVMRLGWARTAMVGAAALALVLSANVLRSALLVLPESGMLPITGTAHEMVGVACWGAAALAIGRLAALRGGRKTIVKTVGGAGSAAA